MQTINIQVINYVVPETKTHFFVSLPQFGNLDVWNLNIEKLQPYLYKYCFWYMLYWF